MRTSVLALITMVVSFCVLSLTSFSQANFAKKSQVVSDGVIYLNLDGGDLRYFQSKNDNSIPIKTGKTLYLTSNEVSIYLHWLNPLAYELSWKDSVFDDSRDKTISSFISLLTAQFGSALGSANATKTNRDNNQTLLFSSPTNRPARGVAVDTLVIPSTGFNSPDLTFLYIQLRLQEAALRAHGDLKVLNAFVASVSALDSKLADDLPSEIRNAVKELYGQTKVSVASDKVALQRSNVVGYSSDLSKEQADASKAETQLQGIKLNDPLLDALFKTTVKKFLNELSSNRSARQQLVSMLTTILDLFDKSMTSPSSGKDAQIDYYRTRDAEYSDGKSLQLGFVIKQNTIDFDKLTVTDSKELLNSKLTLKSYDAVDVTVAAGIFYGNTSFVSYGVSPSGADKFVVSEQQTEKSSAITALFCNLNFNVHSRYFSPLIQIGIDPTKKNPFMLLGGGFSIPSTRFAISAGGIWSWMPQLQHLQVGEQVSSTSDLDSDIKTKFNVSPKGFYLGIMYNF